MFGKCVMCCLLLCANAWSEVVSAQLRFLVWRPQHQQGIHISGSEIEFRPEIEERLFLGPNKQAVTVREKRCSTSLEYRGDRVIKLMRGSNVVSEFAVQNGDVYVLEVNPRASRTIPFVSKAIGMPLAKLATKIMLGVSLDAQNVSENRESNYYAVKEALFPFSKFMGVGF